MIKIKLLEMHVTVLLYVDRKSGNVQNMKPVQNIHTVKSMFRIAQVSYLVYELECVDYLYFILQLTFYFYLDLFIYSGIPI